MNYDSSCGFIFYYLYYDQYLLCYKKKADLGKYIIIISLDEIYSSKLWKALICHPVMPETMSQYVKVNF